MKASSESCKLPITILIAEDDEDDRLLISEAFADHCDCIRTRFVNDGLELWEYLQNEPILPGLIITDVNMPKLDGSQVLKKIKTNSRLMNIPIIMFTTSSEEDLIAKSYCTGVNSFIRKPFKYDELENIVDLISRYWCEIVLLPRKECDIQEETASRSSNPIT
jgi:two-component system, response regulator